MIRRHGSRARSRAGALAMVAPIAAAAKGNPMVLISTSHG